MVCWCRQCRKWVYQEHFLQLKQGWGIKTYDACGQGRDDIRYHPGNPLCGDTWRLKNGTYLVVDYHETFCTGITISDGEKVIERKSCGYTCTYQTMLENEQAELISTFEELPYPKGVDHRGWNDPKYVPDTADRDGKRSVAFLKTVLRIAAASQV